jgi:hypothetical protein
MRPAYAHERVGAPSADALDEAGFARCGHCHEICEETDTNGDCGSCASDREAWEANTPEWVKLGMRSQWEG